jgi:hypothetical protein
MYDNMKKTFIARLLLTLAAIIFGIGAVLHAAAYWSKSRTRIDMSDLPAFLAAELKVLWLADSTTLMALAIIFAFIAAKPASVAPRVIVLLAVIPAGTTLLLYLILGAFYAAHLLALATGMVVIAGLMMPSRLQLATVLDRTAPP